MTDGPRRHRLNLNAGMLWPACGVQGARLCLLTCSGHKTREEMSAEEGAVSQG